MLSIKKVRRMLGNKVEDWSDDSIQTFTDSMYALIGKYLDEHVDELKIESKKE